MECVWGRTEMKINWIKRPSLKETFQYSSVFATNINFNKQLIEMESFRWVQLWTVTASWNQLDKLLVIKKLEAEFLFIYTKR